MTAAETSEQAIMRAAQVAIDAVRDATGDRWLKTAGELEPGEWVRVASAWYEFAGLSADGKMRLLVGDREFRFGPGTEPDERFVWADGPLF